MRRVLLLAIVTFLGGCSAPIAPRHLLPAEEVEKIAMAEAPALPVWTLPEKERLVYSVKWLGIPAGEIVTEISGLTEVRGRKAYMIDVTARTVGFCSMLYKIEDRYRSYLDAEKLHVLRNEIHRREGGYKKDSMTDFDQDLHKAHFKSATDGSEKVFDVPPDVQDTFTASYFLRTVALRKGQVVKIPISNSEKNYDVYVSIPQEETLSIPGYGREEVFYIQPFARLNNDEVREGRMTGFVSVENGHLPYFVVIKAPVFTSVTAMLSVDNKHER